MNRVFKIGILLVCLPGCMQVMSPGPFEETESLLPIAESLIDDFYSFDAKQLEGALAGASDSKASVLYYQGWAEGGNYEIVERKRCLVKERNVVSCPVTVKDDSMLALGVDFFVTDTFEVTFEERKISRVRTSSNDLPIYYEARDWVRSEMPELIAVPCEGFFDGGLTPGDCARAMAEGYRRFAASGDRSNR